MSTPKVSVIIPIYQAEKSIERCCRSLFAQSLEQMEFIFVNDGSTDKSIDIIKKNVEDYPGRKAQVIIIDRKENRGVSYSRQEGLEHASGEFVIHCDSDDWVEPTTYQILYETAVSEKAEIVCCGYQITSQKGLIGQTAYSSSHHFDTLNFNISPQTGSVWNKLIRKQLIDRNHISFIPGIGWGEDFCFSISCLLTSSKTICIMECPYHYWQSEESITHTLTANKVEELVCVARNVEFFLKKKRILSTYEEQLNYLKFQVKAPFLMFKETRNLHRWNQLYPECHRQIWKYNSPLYLRLAAVLASHGFTSLAKAELNLRDFISENLRR